MYIHVLNSFDSANINIILHYANVRDSILILNDDVLCYYKMLTDKEHIIISRIVQRIKELRDKNNKSQREVYYNTNVSIGRIEQGNENIKITTLMTLCKYFNVSISDFLKDIEQDLD